MFGFKKKKQKPLWIMAKDVMDLIQSDYETDMSFTLIEFHSPGCRRTEGKYIFCVSGSGISDL